MVEKIAFTKEEIESRVKVPAIVEVELKHLIEERLKQSGLYYRIFSRISPIMPRRRFRILWDSV